MSRTGATRLLSTSAASAVHQTLKALADMRVRWGGLHASVCCIALRARAICASCIRPHAERSSAAPEASSTALAAELALGRLNGRLMLPTMASPRPETPLRILCGHAVCCRRLRRGFRSHGSSGASGSSMSVSLV